MKVISIVFLLLQMNTVEAVIINIDKAIAFQDEGTTNIDHSALLRNVDGVLGPDTEGTVDFDYYANGTSDRYFDALSLKFDISNVGYSNIQGAFLRFYTQKGSYSDTTWQHYQVLEGAFNSTNEDQPADVIGPIDFCGGCTILSNTTVGWLEESIDLSWITSNDFNVTLRLWNARIDRVELQVITSAVPVPSVIWLFSSGLVGLIVVRGYSKKLF